MSAPTSQLLLSFCWRILRAVFGTWISSNLKTETWNLLDAICEAGLLDMELFFTRLPWLEMNLRVMVKLHFPFSIIQSDYNKYRHSLSKFEVFKNVRHIRVPAVRFAECLSSVDEPALH